MGTNHSGPMWLLGLPDGNFHDASTESSEGSRANFSDACRTRGTVRATRQRLMKLCCQTRSRCRQSKKYLIEGQDSATQQEGPRTS